MVMNSCNEKLQSLSSPLGPDGLGSIADIAERIGHGKYFPGDPFINLGENLLGAGIKNDATGDKSPHRDFRST